MKPKGKSVTLTAEQALAIAECLGEGCCGLGVADDADELIHYRLEDNSPKEVRQWAKNWDIAIEFHNKYVKSGKFEKPWVVRTLEEQLEDNSDE